MCSGVAWVVDVKKIDAKMEVLEVASIGRTTERADSSEKNIIIIYLNGGCRFCCGCAADNRDLRGGAMCQRFNSPVGFGMFFAFLRCFYNFLLTDLIEK